MKFGVLVSGTPPLTIKWFRNKKEILSGVDVSIQKDDSSSSLELFFTKPSDSGDYICEISNDVGSDSCQSTLFVKGFYLIIYLIRDASILFLLLLNTHTEKSNLLLSDQGHHGAFYLASSLLVLGFAAGNEFLIHFMFMTFKMYL